MFGSRRVSVAIGDIFIETLSGKKKIFRSMGVAESTPADAFEAAWEVTELLQFNNLPHARLASQKTDQVRTISIDALERQEIYKKKL